jgi:hypothetical protein
MYRKYSIDYKGLLKIIIWGPNLPFLPMFSPLAKLPLEYFSKTTAGLIRFSFFPQPTTNDQLALDVTECPTSFSIKKRLSAVALFGFIPPPPDITLLVFFLSV